jgi:hypothetical protein
MIQQQLHHTFMSILCSKMQSSTASGAIHCVNVSTSRQ